MSMWDLEADGGMMGMGMMGGRWGMDGWDGMLRHGDGEDLWRRLTPPHSLLAQL